MSESFLVAYALDSGVVNGDILIAGQHSAEPGKFQELLEVLQPRERFTVLFRTPLFPTAP